MTKPNWEKFWELMDQEIPPEAIHAARKDLGIFGDYLTGQYVIQQANKLTGECGLEWHTEKLQIYREFYPDSYIVVRDLDVVVTDHQAVEHRRPGCGVGRALAPVDRKTGEKKPIGPQQMDTAEKAALTDAIKNAWSKFGRFLGGELYFDDEKVAALLGWEIESDRPGAAPNTEEDLAEFRIRDEGWGKDHKFGGMTLEEVYEDEDGLGAMAWCAADESRQSGFVNRLMAKYYNMRQQEPELEDASAEPMVKIRDRNVKAKTVLSAEWATYIAKEVVAHVGEGKLFGHGNYFTNHLKKHFNCAKVMDLTGEKAAALVRYIDSGGEDKDPRWYKEETAEESATSLFGEESLEDLVVAAADNLPPVHKKNPRAWLKALLKQYKIKEPLNAKQVQGMRDALAAVKLGLIDWKSGSDSLAVFDQGMKKVAKDGK